MGRWMASLVILSFLVVASVFAARETLASPEPGSIRFVEEAVAVSERDGLAIIWVVREAGGGGPASVQYEVVADTAQAGSDYGDTGMTLEFYGTDWQTMLIQIPIIDDDLREEPERLAVVLHDPIGATLAGAATLTIEIFDDDQIPPGGALWFAGASNQAKETQRTVSLQVSRLAGSVGPASARCMVVGGTAEPDVDYRFSATTLTWPDRDTEPRAVTVEILNDQTEEGLESVVLGFQAVSGATLFSPSFSTLVIEDDDPAGPGPNGSSGMGNISPCFLGVLR